MKQNMKTPLAIALSLALLPMAATAAGMPVITSHAENSQLKNDISHDIDSTVEGHTYTGGETEMINNEDGHSVHSIFKDEAKQTYAGHKGQTGSSLGGMFLADSHQDNLADGTLNATHDTFSGDDAAQRNIGGGTLNATHDTFSGEVALQENDKGTLNAKNDIFSGDHAGQANKGTGTLNSTNDTFSGNSTYQGNEYGGTLNATHDTFSGEFAFQENDKGTLNAKNDIFSGEHASQANRKGGMLNSTGDTFSGEKASQANEGNGTLNSTGDTFSGEHAVQRNTGAGTLNSTNNTFSGHAVQENTGTGTLHSKNDTFRGDAVQVISAKSDSNTSHHHDRSIQVMEGTSTGDTFDGNATQFVEKGSKTNNNQFDGSAHQVVNTGATSTGTHFTSHSVQNLYGNSDSDVFTGNATQSVEAGSKTNNNQFDGSAHQVVNTGATSTGTHFTSHSVQNLYGNSDSDVFTGNATQSVEAGSKTNKDQFNGSAHQVVNTGATSTGTHFTGQSVQELTGSSNGDSFAGSARQMIAKGGASLSATFDGSSGFDETGFTSTIEPALAPQPTLQHVTMKGSSVGTLRQNVHATDLTLSDNAALHMEASNAFAGGKGADADRVTLNSPNSRLVIDDVPSAQQDTAHVGTLTMTGGSLQFAPIPAGKNTPYSALNVDNLSGRGTLGLNVDNVQGKTLNNQVHATSASGQYGILLNTHTSGKELLKGSAPDLVDIDKATHASFDLRDIKGEHIDSVDAGAYLASLKTVTGADGKTHITLNQNTQQTTRSADAVLGLMSSSQYIFDNELQGLRARRGDIQQNPQGEGGVWGRYINSDMHVKAAGTAAYRMEQNGTELGGDKVFTLGDDQLALGGLASFSKTNLKQDRGNSSDVSSYGAGLYATYLSHLGYYVDGVVKLNRFNNNLRSHTEVGQGVSGSYNQNGMGASLETGYHYTTIDSVYIDPYIRATYFTAQSSDVTLSNRMEAKMDALHSAKAEAGVAVGKAFALKNGISLNPYVTVAAEHEFIKSNSVRINDAHNFDNDASGTTGKYGAGISAQVAKNTSVYAEADYRNGSHVESPIMGNVGFRINF